MISWNAINLRVCQILKNKIKQHSDCSKSKKNKILKNVYNKIFIISKCLDNIIYFKVSIYPYIFHIENNSLIGKYISLLMNYYATWLSSIIIVASFI